MKSSVQLIQEAQNYRYNPSIPLRIYLKTCIGLLDKAQLNFQNNDNSMAFMFYYRYMDLVTNKLSTHQEYMSSVDSLHRREYLQLIKLEVPCVLKIIEDLQETIDDNYKKHELSLAKNIAKAKPTQLTHQTTYETLPSTFNERRFNQSLNFLHSQTTFNNNTTTNNNSMNNNNSNNNNSNNSNIQDNSNEMYHYPELPQLSYSSF
ncbi:hypothetical protein KAFR_0C03630 [Kazachstania africana CBS 2517]|uniref:Regulator of free ubiquitin chains 1 n=1 Tax=Kazachstania africana (strain ATCC 22294 / BCRC 22015 / CBS 2517 / CECT 1963 / NBRC 1671 / NRRL Y-8276) TaxID=1071382 RepID=H2ASK5_KAZAF|nr:hypothetical protein KAFR_0C03630 [Kazachstania africana CBS 2517]CCF57355.1 hypothetical protein KAFR_0C03630 [Kazachstania africana CBS 2517]